ncbi:hypothetical protein R6Q57_021649 [Mikania cordata]
MISICEFTIICQHGSTSNTRKKLPVEPRSVAGASEGVRRPEWSHHHPNIPRDLRRRQSVTHLAHRLASRCYLPAVRTHNPQHEGRTTSKGAQSVE